MAQQSKTQFGYRRHPDQDRAVTDPAGHPVVVVGAGPVGLSLAIDLAQRGQPVVLLDDADRIGEGSRAICFSKRALEYWDRLGAGQRMVDKGVVWSVGKIFHGASQLYQFNLLPEQGHKRPAFINLQQFHAEAYLVDRVRELPAIDLRWRNKVIGLQQRNDHVVLTIETPDGPYPMHAHYVVACDGARSSLRQMAGAEFAGQVFEDQFLIADVRMTAEFPTERWFWFDPPFHAGRSALLHKQPDDIWRIDLQLDPDADPAVEKRPENVRPRIARMLGHDKFDFEWISLYKFQCRRMDKFIHGRVMFAGDAAHQVSPFGARGANSGLEDAENLAWKLDRVLHGSSPEALLDTYHVERSAAADENIRESTRSTDFMAPGSRQEARLRKAVLSLARETEFGKRMVNGGRLSVPSTYDTPLSTADTEAWRGGPVPGASIPDAPLGARPGGPTFLTEAFIQTGTRFTLLAFANGAAVDPPDGIGVIHIGVNDGDLVWTRYDAEPGTAYLLRPDGYVAARFRHPTRAALDTALARAAGIN
ncbi:MAG: FAD-dependent oxidoreductase [Bradyrhizobium sp.]|uniref:FAD-dependent oxidoreductase n=1 Tax=Bradyrhizobium sp. TaxID=376 RepID=UPI0012160F9A|nr:FAD-dependent oxidoreductase [Bradyrhizobium sp.]THD60365.1 MAG: FAD-dependent oxidoreductase [Bradyrhizobium sp.]